MLDLGEFNARTTVRSSAEEQEAVFARHRDRVQTLMLDKKPDDDERLTDAKNG